MLEKKILFITCTCAYLYTCWVCVYNRHHPTFQEPDMEKSWPCRAAWWRVVVVIRWKIKLFIGEKYVFYHWYACWHYKKMKSHIAPYYYRHYSYKLYMINFKHVVFLSTTIKANIRPTHSNIGRSHEQTSISKSSRNFCKEETGAPAALGASLFVDSKIIFGWA